MPYRTGGDEQHLSQQGSVVDDLVRQFADPYAFLRELVQNAIDAGATRIRVHMDRDGRSARWSVEDDGVGMTLATIEGPLLTAFSSSKEGQSGSIGKYGVGFLSVFGMAPTVVRVLTHRAEGAHEVRLFPDHSFEIEELPPRPGHGTTVVVEHPVPPGGDLAHEDRGEQSLVRWCRHATVPIEIERPAPSGRRRARIDRPLGLVAPVVVEVEEDGVVALVGPAAGTERMAREGDGREGTGAFAGFYNRGLTLVEAESGAHVVAGLRFKVSSARLRHTLSRDDVVHDREHARALDLVRRTGREAMRDALARKLEEVVRRASDGGGFDHLDALLAAAAAHLPPARIVVPVVAASPGRPPLVDLAHLPEGDTLLVTRDAEGPARAVARRGALIVRTPPGDAEANAFVTDLAALTGRMVRHVDELSTRLVPRGGRELGAAADDLAEALGAALAAVGEPFAAVRFAAAEGQRPPGLAVVVPHDEPLPLVLLPEHLVAFRDGAGSRSDLVLLADHPLVAPAVRAADDDPAVAAALVARVVLLELRGAVSASQADDLLVHAATVSA